MQWTLQLERHPRRFTMSRPLQTMASAEMGSWWPAPCLDLDEALQVHYFPVLSTGSVTCTMCWGVDLRIHDSTPALSYCMPAFREP
jgi:hypothetical protein